MVMPDKMAPRAPPAGGLSACRARATACVHRVALGVSHLRWSVVSGFCEPPCSQVMATASPTISKAGSKLFPTTLEVRGRRSKACLVACARSFLARIHPSDPPCRALTPALCPL